MATDFNNNAITSSGGFKPSTKDTPLDIRSRVETENDIPSIPNPYVGMLIFVKDTGKRFEVLSLKEEKIGLTTVNVIDEYKEFSVEVEVPTKISQLENDNGYVTEDYVKNEIENAQLNKDDITIDLSEYQKKSDENLNTKDKTIVGAINEINNESIKAKDYDGNVDFTVGGVEVKLDNFQEKTDENLNTENKNIVGAINELFQNVSNGKTLIATAITDKGIDTSSDDSFQVMADNISLIKANTSKGDLPAWWEDMWIKVMDASVRSAYGGTCVIGDRLFVIGGQSDVSEMTGKLEDIMINRYCDCYIIDSKSRRTVGNMLTSRMGLGVTSVGEYAYAIGGTDGDKYLNVVERTNGVNINHVWEQMRVMPTARAYFTADTIGDKIYCIGGGKSSSDAYSNILEIYDTITNTWSTGKNLPSSIRKHASSVVEDKIYCIGGGSSGGYLNSNYCYDPLTDTWSTKENMPTNREDLTATSIGDKVYCMGGFNGSYLKTNQSYDVITNTWANEEDLPLGLKGGMSATVNGFIYFIGGNGSTWSKDIYCYITK